MVPETPREHGTTRCLPCPRGEHNPYHLGIWDNSEDPGGWHVWSPRAKQDRAGGPVSLPGLEARFQLSYHHLSSFSPSIVQTRNAAGASPELNEGQFVNRLLIPPLNLCLPTRQNTSLSVHPSFPSLSHLHAFRPSQVHLLPGRLLTLMVFPQYLAHSSCGLDSHIHALPSALGLISLDRLGATECKAWAITSSPS